MTPDPGFGIYVHWPFCLAKCPYCDFNSHVARRVDQRVWANALVKDLRTQSEGLEKRAVTSIFFGGGTPSLMEGETVARILSEVRLLWPFSNDVEITLEANPTSAEASRFTAYRQAGVNRLSLGVQSLNDKDLKNLGRLHTADEALQAFELARTIFPRLSFDLIYARQGQSQAAWKDELEKALTFAADHLSLYQLTLEQGTPFYELGRKGDLVLPGEEEARALYEMTEEICADADLKAYEVSNYATPGAEGRHNLTYWRYGDYLGIGPGAHGRVSRGGKHFSTSSEPLPGKWLAQMSESDLGGRQDRALAPQERFEECVMMGLRLKDGLSKSRAEAVAEREVSWSHLEDLIEQGLLTAGETHVAATRQGRLVLNTLVVEVLRRVTPTT